MAEVAQAFRNGGIWMYLILLMIVLTLTWVLIQSILGLIGKRLPAALWWIGPALIAAIALVGSGVGMAEAIAAVESASPEHRQRLLAMGFALSLNTVLFGSIANAVLGGTIALGAGLGNAFGVGDENDVNLATSVAAVVVAFVASFGLAAWVLLYLDAGLLPLVIPASLFFGGIGCGLAELRSDTSAEPDNRRVSDRLTAAGGMLFGVLSGSITAVCSVFVDGYRAMEIAAPQHRGMLVARISEYAWQVAYVGITGCVVALVITAIILISVRGRLTSRPVMVDAGTCLLVFLPVLAGLVYTTPKVQQFIPAIEQTLVTSQPPDAEM